MRSPQHAVGHSIEAVAAVLAIITVYADAAAKFAIDPVRATLPFRTWLGLSIMFGVRETDMRRREFRLWPLRHPSLHNYSGSTEE